MSVCRFDVLCNADYEMVFGVFVYRLRGILIWNAKLFLFSGCCGCLLLCGFYCCVGGWVLMSFLVAY